MGSSLEPSRESAGPGRGPSGVKEPWERLGPVEELVSSRQPFEVGAAIPHRVGREVKAQRINGLAELQVKYVAGPELASVPSPRPVLTTPRWFRFTVRNSLQTRPRACGEEEGD